MAPHKSVLGFCICAAHQSALWELQLTHNALSEELSDVFVRVAWSNSMLLPDFFFTMLMLTSEESTRCTCNQPILLPARAVRFAAPVGMH